MQTCCRVTLRQYDVGTGAGWGRNILVRSRGSANLGPDRGCRPTDYRFHFSCPMRTKLASILYRFCIDTESVCIDQARHTSGITDER